MIHGARNAQGSRVQHCVAGAALVEFAIVLPFILIAFLGIIEIGRVFSQVAWYAAANYEAVVSGTMAPPDSTLINAAVNSSFAKTILAYQQNGNVRLAANPEVLDPSGHADIVNRSVKIETRALPTSVFGYITQGISMSFEGNLLTKGGAPVEEYSQFANPNPGYNCLNEPVGTSDSACNF